MPVAAPRVSASGKVSDDHTQQQLSTQGLPDVCDDSTTAGKPAKRRRIDEASTDVAACDAAAPADLKADQAAAEKQQRPLKPAAEPHHHSEVEASSEEYAQSDDQEDEELSASVDAAALYGVVEELQQQQQQQGHPYGVQPWGNYYLSRVPDIRTAGLGVLSGLSDDVILGMLELLSAADLARLGLASKVLYCFAHTNDLWKALVLQELGGNFDWCGTWRETYLAHTAPGYKLGSHKPLQVAGFYSDLLHQPWFCATVGLQPAWLEVDNIDRRAGLTADQFRAEYESRNRPVLLTDSAADWPALHKWTQDYLAAALAGRPVIVGNAAWRFGSYLSYCRSGAELDEMPLYMFDKAFASACPHLTNDYRVPAVFTEDLFGVLGEEQRPDYRWLIIGPHRSGSSFHVDPNATCAWNAVVTGTKKWILFPPGTPPPGVHASPDGADVAAPVSIIEWFLNFYDEARNSKTPPIECICRPGEVLYVPRGWWHCVLNLGHTVAVTQNYVSSTGLHKVLDFLKPGRVELVSGCGLQDRSSLHDRFVAALEQQHPDVLAAVRQQQEQQRQQREAEHRLSELFKCSRQQQQKVDVQSSSRQGGVQQDGGCEGGSQPNAIGVGAAAGGLETQSTAGFSFGFSLNGADRLAGDAEEEAAGGGDSRDTGCAEDQAGVGFSFGFSLPTSTELQQDE